MLLNNPILHNWHLTSGGFTLPETSEPVGGSVYKIPTGGGGSTETKVLYNL